MLIRLLIFYHAHLRHTPLTPSFPPSLSTPRTIFVSCCCFMQFSPAACATTTARHSFFTCRLYCRVLPRACRHMSRAFHWCRYYAAAAERCFVAAAPPRFILLLYCWLMRWVDIWCLLAQERRLLIDAIVDVDDTAFDADAYFLLMLMFLIFLQKHSLFPLPAYWNSITTFRTFFSVPPPPTMMHFPTAYRLVLLGFYALFWYWWDADVCLKVCLRAFIYWADADLIDAIIALWFSWIIRRHTLISDVVLCYLFDAAICRRAMLSCRWCLFDDDAILLAISQSRYSHHLSALSFIFIAIFTFLKRRFFFPYQFPPVAESVGCRFRRCHLLSLAWCDIDAMLRVLITLMAMILIDAIVWCRC